MDENSFVGGPIRERAFQKLKSFLKNPGKFSLIVLGSRGTGKHFAIVRAFKMIQASKQKELCLKDLQFIQASEIPADSSTLDSLFKKHEYMTLVVEDVEKLNDQQQSILFTALSTTDGTFGINSRYNLRVVFTSSGDADALRSNEELLQGLFWDRISQLIVEFPSFKMEKENILADFEATWRKMKFHTISGFEQLSAIPKIENLHSFLENNAEKFEGGFRDLDKLACLYFNYRIFFYESKRKIDSSIEKMVLDNVRDDFFGKSQMHGLEGNDLSTFQIQPGFSMNDLVGQFKIQVRNWGKKEYGTISSAAKKLGLSQSTMKNYTERKVTKSHQERYSRSKGKKK